MRLDPLVDFLMKAQSTRRASNTQRSLSACRDPLLVLCRPVLELTRRNVKCDAPAFVGTEANTIECNKSSERELHAFRDVGGRAEIYLRHFVGSNGSLVLDADLYVGAAVTCFD